MQTGDTPASEQSPDYVPAMWTGSLRRWLGSSPRRVFFWLLAVPPAAAALTAYLFFVAKTGGIAALAGTAVLFWQAIRYAPRAWRAWRSESASSGDIP